MINSDMYAEIIDRHVELADDLGRAGNLLNVATNGRVDGEQLAQTLVAVAQLAEQLDQLTLDLAMRLVPIDWWASRPGHVSNSNDARATTERSGLST